MRRVLGILILIGCGGREPQDSPPPTTDTGSPTDTGVAWPLWVYQFVVHPEVSEFTVDGAPLVRLDGYAWSGSFGGPAIIAETDHKVVYTVTNSTALELPIDFPGVDVLDPMVVPVASADAVTFLTTEGPGEHVYRVADDTLARSGLFGMTIVRDPAEFPVEEIEKQANVLLVDLPLELAEVDGCRTGAVSDTATPCPAWTPAPAEYGTVFVAQRILVNAAPGRHGGPPNEFQTTTVDDLYFGVGDDVRIGFASLSAAAHTLHLGGLTWTDPQTGEARDQIAVEPDEGAHLLIEAVGPAGTYALSCLDHDHHGLDRVTIHVEE